ncbi:MAG: hypothetical protein M3335_11155 [Actinomycetota bacterium]|nr:hypothetical protein [Actinomycetota bacterium]
MRDSADKQRVRTRSFLLALLTCALCAVLAPSAGAAPATFAGASADGEAVFFTTTEKLVTGDTDTRVDVYVRSFDEALGSYVTRQVSVGPVGGNDAHPSFYVAASADGSRVIVATEEKLVAADRDVSEDIYLRDLEQNTTALVSAGAADCAAQGCGSANLPASFAPGGVIPSGQKVFFHSSEQLAPEDEDESPDVYVRDVVAGTTTLVSAGAAGCAGAGCGNGAFPASFRGASADGTKVFLTTDEQLVSSDADSLLDIYRRDVGAGVTVQVSLPGTCPAGADCSASYGGASADGSHAYFETNERLSAGDEDDAQDVYDWSGGVATRVSTGSPGGNEKATAATFTGASADGSRIFFETSESLVEADTDAAHDLYERAGGKTSLVSTGPAGGNAEVPASLRWVSPNDSSEAVLFTTEEPLVEADEDGAQDVYARDGGVTTLRTSGNGEFNASFAGASADGSHVFVVTAEKLAAGDTDTALDVYGFHGGTTTLVSTGPLAGKTSIPAGLPTGGVAADGSHVFFTTEERVTEGDLDAEADVYDRFEGGTLLASTGNSAALGPPTPSQLSTDPASPGTSLTPAIKGQSDPNTAIKIYTTPDCSGAPVATGTSVELGGAGITVTVEASSTNSFRATATDTNGDTSPCSAAVSYTHQSSTPPPPPPPPPGEEGGSGGGTGGTGDGSGGAGGGSKGGKGGVVYVTPQTRITFAPASKTRARRPVFRFTDSTGQEGSTFKCKVDKGRWSGCNSPVKLKKLKLGRHVFQVKAVNAVGTPEPRPVKRAFKVVR